MFTGTNMFRHARKRALDRAFSAGEHFENVSLQEESMRAFVLATVVGAGILLVASLEASAVPANGAAIARIGQQVDSVISARKQHVDPAINARKRQVAPSANNRCFGAQTRDRYGYCVPNFRR
jgi:hypothetical protein